MGAQFSRPVAGTPPQSRPRSQTRSNTTRLRRASDLVVTIEVTQVHVHCSSRQKRDRHPALCKVKVKPASPPRDGVWVTLGKVFGSIWGVFACGAGAGGGGGGGWCFLTTSEEEVKAEAEGLVGMNGFVGQDERNGYVREEGMTMPPVGTETGMRTGTGREVCSFFPPFFHSGVSRVPVYLSCSGWLPGLLTCG